MKGPAMTPERWAAVEALYWRLVDLSPDERTGMLEEAHASDPALALDVQGLLEEHATDPDFLGTPVGGARLGADATVGEEAGRGSGTIGPYRLVRPLGRGGMGDVYLAVHEAEGVRQFVALKVMRRGLDTGDLIRRFQRERRILASLNHPSIARLLHVGSSDEGRPYLVMEYVEGVPLDEYGRRDALDLPARLRLIQEVCAAVQHAHQNLVVHRDLKPSNIMVTPQGKPKLLDFGVAKILEEEGHGSTTVAGAQGPLTPEYASPEQLRGEMVGIPSDVYSLGVILYEFLAGRHPYAARGTDRGPVGRTVLDRDPPRPSSVNPSLAGDLDTIVLKAMAKEPERRYLTAASLAEDVQRHLQGHPVLARPATLGYTLGRFARRNRVAVAAATALFVLMTAFSTITTVQSRRIREEAARVAQERDKALQVQSFLLEMFGATGPDQATGDTVTAHQLLDRRAAALDREYGDQPEVRAEMQNVLAEGYEKLGLLHEAEPLARQALDARRALLAAPHPDLASSLNTWGWILHRQGKASEAEAPLREALDMRRTLFPEGHGTLARSLNDLGVNREAQGAYDEAEALYGEALAMRRTLLGAGSVGAAVTASNLAVVRYRKGDYAGAVAMAREAHAAFTEALGPDHQRTMIVENNMAAMQAAMGDWGGARNTYRDILERRRRLLGPRHPQVAASMTALASTLPTTEGVEESEALLREALDIQTEALGIRHPEVASTARRLGSVLSRSGRATEARRFFDQALEIFRGVAGPDHPQVGETLALLAASQGDAGDRAGAQASYLEALRIYTAAFGLQHVNTARVEVAMAHNLVHMGEVDEAALHLGRASVALARALPDGHNYRQEARAEEADLALARGERARADSVLTEAERLLTEEQGRQPLGAHLRGLRSRLERAGG